MSLLLALLSAVIGNIFIATVVSDATLALVLMVLWSSACVFISVYGDDF